MKNNFKFLIVLSILLAGCICVGSTFAADVSVSDQVVIDNDIDNTQSIEIAHDDSSQKDVEISKVNANDNSIPSLSERTTLVYLNYETYVYDRDTDTFNGTFNFILTKAADIHVHCPSGSIVLYYDNNEYTATISEGTSIADPSKATVTIPYLKNGTTFLGIYYSGDSFYDSQNKTIRLDIPGIRVSGDSSISFGEDYKVTLTLTESYSGSFYLYYSNGTLINSTDLATKSTSFTLKDLAVGEYTVYATFKGETSINTSSSYFKFNVTKANPNMNVSVENVTYGDAVVGVATVPSDATGTVSFSIDNETWIPIPITDDNNVEFSFTGLDLGNYILFVKYSGDDNYNPTYSENPFTVNQLKTVVTVDPVKGKAGEKVTITARVTDEDGNPVEDGKVIIGFNGKEYEAYVENGIATVEVVLPIAGNYSATAYYEGFNYNSSYTVFTVEVSDIPGPNPNPTPKPIHNGVGNMENTGNPLVVLLIALCAIGLESLRRKF